MKKIMVFMLAVMLSASVAEARGGHGHSSGHSRSYSHSSHGSGTYTRGYTKKSGKYVSGYHHTHRDHTKYNNYSTKGNSNPYTGKAGTVDPLKH